MLEKNSTRSHFLRWSWSRLWLHCYAPAGSELYLLICRDVAGKPAGLAPLYMRPRRFCGVTVLRELNFIGTGVGLHTSEHLDLLALPGAERPVAEAVARFLLGRQDWDRIWLWSWPARSASLPELQRFMAATVRECDRVHYINTNCDWESVRAGWSRKFRYNVERSVRVLGKRNVACFERVTTREALESALNDFVGLHQKRWISKGHAGSFTLPRFEEFMRAAIREAFNAGQLRFWLYRLDGQCVASLVAFVDNGVAHYFQGGFDPAYAKYSLGSVMLLHCVRDCAADPAVREFDFMGGGSAYKDKWTNLTRVNVEFECLRPGWRATSYRYGARVWRTLRRLLRSVRERQQGADAMLAVMVLQLACAC